MSPTSIYHLPDEILSYIFEDPNVPVDSLFNVASTTRLLHFLALPLFLQRFNILDPNEYTEIVFTDNPVDELDALSGLEIALYFTDIKHLECRFEASGGNQDILMAMRHMWRLNNFLSRLSSVEKVTFSFKNERCGCCAELGEGETLDDTLEEWSAIVGKTFSKVVERSCKEMIIRGGRYLGHVYSFRSSHHPSRGRKNSGPLNAIKNLFGKRNTQGGPVESPDWINVISGDNWRFRRVKGTGNKVVLTPLSVNARLGSNLRSLTIESTMLLVPPILHWTISVLKYMPIQSLALHNLSINRKCWPSIFTLIGEAIPHLSELHLVRIRQIAAADLLLFVTHFPHLKSMHLGDIDCVDSYDLGVFPDFPLLITLHAPASLVHKLLSCNRTGLSRLESLTIAYQLRNDGLSHWLHRSVVPSIPIFLKEQQRPLTLSMEVRLGNTPGWKMSQDLNSTAESGREHSGLEDITGLTLVIDQRIKKTDLNLGSILPQWLGLFLGLRYLSVNTNPKAIKEEELTKLVRSVVGSGVLEAISCLEVNGVEVGIGSATRGISATL